MTTMNPLSPAWSDLHEGLRIRWVTPRFVRVGIIVRIKKSSIKLRWQGRDITIPNARWYWVQGKTEPKGDEYMELAPVTQETAQEYDRRLMDLSPEFDITPAQAAELYAISAKDIRRWLRSGKITGVQKAGGWWIDSVSLGRYLAEKR